jgi:hypothetical protein
VRKENWTQRQPYKRGAAAVVNLKIQILCPALFIVDARSQKNARCPQPIAWCVAGSALLKTKKPETRRRVWLRAGSAEVIEKFLAEYYYF